MYTSLHTPEIFFPPFLCFFLRTPPNICFTWLHKKLTLFGTGLAQIKSSSINWNAAISQIYPQDSLSHPGGIGRAVGVLWDRHKLCEHSCRAILVCLLAQWLHACLLGSLFASDGENTEWTRRAGSRHRDPARFFEALGTLKALICCWLGDGFKISMFDNNNDRHGLRSSRSRHIVTNKTTSSCESVQQVGSAKCLSNAKVLFCLSALFTLEWVYE